MKREQGTRTESKGPKAKAADSASGELGSIPQLKYEVIDDVFDGSHGFPLPLGGRMPRPMDSPIPGGCYGDPAVITSPEEYAGQRVSDNGPLDGTWHQDEGPPVTLVNIGPVAITWLNTGSGTWLDVGGDGIDTVEVVLREWSNTQLFAAPSSGGGILPGQQWVINETLVFIPIGVAMDGTPTVLHFDLRDPAGNVLATTAMTVTLTQI